MPREPQLFECPNCDHQTSQPFCGCCGMRVSQNQFLGVGVQRLQELAAEAEADLHHVVQQRESLIALYQERAAPLDARAVEVEQKQELLKQALRFAQRHNIP